MKLIESNRLGWMIARVIRIFDLEKPSVQVTSVCQSQPLNWGSGDDWTEEYRTHYTVVIATEMGKIQADVYFSSMRDSFAAWDEEDFFIKEVVGIPMSYSIFEKECWLNDGRPYED